jgi:hypothetical protein
MALNSSPPERHNFNQGHLNSDIQVDDAPSVFPYHLSHSKTGNYALTPDNWAYSSSSVLSFDQPGYYSSPDQGEYEPWIDTTMNQNNPNADQYEDCFANANTGHQNSIRKDGISSSGYSEELQLTYMYTSTSSVSTAEDHVSQKRHHEVG